MNIDIVLLSKFLPIVPVLGLVFGLTACSSEPLASPDSEASEEEADSTVEETPSSDPDVPTDEDLETFVAAIASQSVSDLEAAEELVVEGSPAADYLTYYLHLRNASIDSGAQAPGASSVDSIDDGFELCASEGGESFCTTYTDFQGKDGLISDFLVQDRDLAERLVVGDGERVEGPDGSEVEFVAAYRNADDSHLIYAYTVHSGSEPMYMPEVSYRNPDGRQTNPEYTDGAWELSPESYSSYAAWLPAGELGGEATVELWPEDGQPVSVTIEVPAPERKGDAV